MIGSIVQDRFHAHNRISGKRSFYNRFLKPLLHSREVVLRNRAAYNAFFEDIRCIQVPGRLELHLDMSVLAVSAGLFLILHIHIGVLADRLTERNLRRLQIDLHFISCGKLARRDLQMLVAHAVEKRLTVLAVIYNLQRHIFRRHPCKSLGHLILIALILNRVFHECIRYGIVGLRIGYR